MMDAHLFRLFSQALLPILLNARIEKIQAPQKDIFALTFFSQGKKRQLLMRFGRKNPLLGLTSLRLSGQGNPPAEIMRIRKYFNNRRITAALADFAERKLWLLDSATENGKIIWLCLDLIAGPKLFFLNEEETPKEDKPLWPDSTNLDEAIDAWRNWPVLTPALRKTLAILETPDKLTLLRDLEAGGGDVFLYRDEENRIKKISAWPLPQSGGLTEETRGDILEAFNECGNDLIARAFFDGKMQSAVQAADKKRRKLEKLLENLNRDEAELNRRLKGQEEALAIQQNLWRWQKDHKTSSLEFCQDEKPIIIALNPVITIQQNMERMFKKAHGAKKGLEILKQRRKSILAQIASLGHDQTLDAALKPEKAKADQAIITYAQALPKNVQGFVSSDGYLLIRGKNAAGNRTVRKLASPHDLWAHVETGPGAHVVIRNSRPGREIPERTLEEAGNLAACKSWLANSDQASIMFAEIRHVKPIRGSTAGNVAIDRLAFTKSVKLNPELEAKLQAKV